VTEVREIEPPAPLPEKLEADLVVLPREITMDGRGLYDDSVITIVKELRSLGADATYQHEKDDRAWIGEQSAEAVALALIIGVASNAGWSGLQALFRHSFSGKRVHVRVGHYEELADGSRKAEWYEIEGNGEQVADALRQLEVSKGRDEEAGKKEIKG
jgi:hypothetical protein